MDILLIITSSIPGWKTIRIQFCLPRFKFWFRIITAAAHFLASNPFRAYNNQSHPDQQTHVTQCHTKSGKNYNTILAYL